MIYWAQPRNGDKDKIEKWRPSPYLIGHLAAKVVAEVRKEYIAIRDALLVEQKAAGREGKIFRDEARSAMKIYRAACLLLPYVSDEYPGDCKLVPMWEFPPDLYHALNYVDGRVATAREGHP